MCHYKLNIAIWRHSHIPDYLIDILINTNITVSTVRSIVSLSELPVFVHMCVTPRGHLPRMGEGFFFSVGTEDGVLMLADRGRVVPKDSSL